MSWKTVGFIVANFLTSKMLLLQLPIFNSHLKQKVFIFFNKSSWKK